MCCPGNHHGLGKDLPCYTSASGLDGKTEAALRRDPSPRQGMVDLNLCQSNLRIIATSLELWSTYHAGHYPDKLSQLLPQQLRFIPRCRAAGKDTYSVTYKPSRNHQDFSLSCSGDHHHLGQGKPYYDHQTGRARTQ